MPCSREVCRSPFDRKQIAIPWCHLEYDSVQLFLQTAIGYRDARFVQDTIRCVMSAIRLWVKRKFFTTTTGRIGASGTATARVLTKAPMDTPNVMQIPVPIKTAESSNERRWHLHWMPTICPHTGSLRCSKQGGGIACDIVVCRTSTQKAGFKEQIGNGTPTWS